MAKHRVQLFNQSRGVEVDTDATPGATVGVNLTLEDGTVVTYDMLFRQPPSDSGDPGAVYWRTIMEVPPNVTALQNTNSAGLYVVTGQGSSATRAITSDTLQVHHGDGVAGDPEVDLRELPDSGTGALLAIERDEYGRVAGTKDATITGVDGEVTVEHGDAADGLPTIGLSDVPDQGGGTLQRIQRDDKGRVAGTSEATTDDLPEGSNLYFTDERADERIAAAKADPNGVASLVGGKLDAGQLPALAITDTYPVFTEAEMLALPAQQGDVAVRIDLETSFILAAEPASTLSNWQELLSPTGGVTSFNGRTGPVMPATGDYTPAQVGADPAGTAASAVSAHESAPDPHPQYTTASEAAAAAPVQSVNGKQGAVTLNAADVGAAASDDPRLTNPREWTASTVSQAEAEAGTATTRRAWTAQRVRQAIAAWWAGSAAKTMLDGLVVQTVTDGDTTHAPSGDAVFDSLAGKVSKSGDTMTGPLFAGYDSFTIAGDTSEGSDTRRIAITSSSSVSVSRGAYALLHGADHDVRPGVAWITAGAGGYMILTAPVGSTVRPGNDNAIKLGDGPFRWSTVFAGTGTINTSDAREKAEPRDLTEAELAAAADIARLPCIFQWLHAIEEKGEDARLHASPTVQAVIAAMEAHGLDPFRYGFVCYDEWPETPEVKDEETGEVTQEYRPAGDRYSLRPTELAHFVLRGLAHRQDELERRLVALEG